MKDSKKFEMDAYQMPEHQRLLLARSRVYLLHNVRPTEELWATLVAKGTLSTEMIEDIRSCLTMSERVGRLLDMLPARGPKAFDEFCDTLLQCDHGHVAEYLKTHEATDQFRAEIQPYCENTSEHTLDRFVNIFRRNTPLVQRFAERKFQLLIQEQNCDVKQRDQELRQLEHENSRLHLEISQLKNFLNSCSQTMEMLVNEIQHSFVSKSFLQEESQHLENLKLSLEGISDFDDQYQYYANMQVLLQFLEKFAGPNALQDKRDLSFNRSGTYIDQKEPNTSLLEKIHGLVGNVAHIIEGTLIKQNSSSKNVREDLENVMEKLNEVWHDVAHVRDIFKSTLRQKRKLEGEMLSMFHSFREVRRLERELQEKHAHITELSKYGQLIKRKTKSHRRELEQIRVHIYDKKQQLNTLQQALERQLSSADLRVHSLFRLLPDLGDDDFEDDISASLSHPNTPEKGNVSGITVYNEVITDHSTNGYAKTSMGSQNCGLKFYNGQRQQKSSVNVSFHVTGINSRQPHPACNTGTNPSSGTNRLTAHTKEIARKETYRKSVESQPIKGSFIDNRGKSKTSSASLDKETDRNLKPAQIISKSSTACNSESPDSEEANDKCHAPVSCDMNTEEQGSQNTLRNISDVINPLRKFSQRQSLPAKRIEIKLPSK